MKIKSGVIALVVLSVIYGSMGLYIRFLSTSFTLLQQVYLRLLFGFLISLIVFSGRIRLSRILSLSINEWLLLFLRSISYYLLGLVLFSKAVLLAKLGNATVIGSIPFTAIMGMFFLKKEKQTPLKLVWIAVSFVGVVIMGIKNMTSFSWGLGETYALLSAFFIGLSAVSRKMHSDRLNNSEISILTLGISSISICVVSFFLGESLPVSNWNIHNFAVLLFSGLLNLLIVLLFNYGMQKVPAVLAGNILTLETVFALFFGFIFYQEIPVFQELIGGGFIVWSIIQMNRLKHR